MRRVFAIASFLIMMTLCADRASAQGIIIKGGLNTSHYASEQIGDNMAWTAGIAYQTYSRAGFSLQPELIYKVNGASLDDAVMLRMNYLELPVNIQWGIDLLIAKPFLFVSPFVGCNLSNLITPDGYVTRETLDKAISTLDYGVGAGIGLNFWRLQLTAKYNWMLGNVADWGCISPDLSGLDINMATFELSLGIKL